MLRDLTNDATQTIRIDSKLQFDALQAFGAVYSPGAVSKLEHYSGERPIFDLFNIEEDIARALARRVDLKSGGYLIIDQTEALTTIDVNTGGFVGARNFDDTIFKTNLEAALAIGRQLRLRNLGGIIIVDFIDMTREEHRAAVLAEFRKQLARDRTKTTVSGFTQLGLVEMTRKRTRESLAHMLCEPCPTCEGRGQVKTARSVCYDILREILREARQFNPKEFRVIASPTVVEMLLDEESAHLAGLSEFVGKPISLSAESAMNPEQYDIVLDVTARAGATWRSGNHEWLRRGPVDIRAAYSPSRARPLMDMRQLRYFVQIVESGSLAKASRQLFIAQPALSQQMARLEDEVGKPLLVRSSRGVVPTDNGEALYHHAKFMLRQLDQAVAVARQDTAALSGRVTLGLAPTTVCQLGLPLMQHLRAKYPGHAAQRRRRPEWPPRADDARRPARPRGAVQPERGRRPERRAAARRGAVRHPAGRQRAGGAASASRSRCTRWPRCR